MSLSQAALETSTWKVGLGMTHGNENCQSHRDHLFPWFKATEVAYLLLLISISPFHLMVNVPSCCLTLKGPCHLASNLELDVGNNLSTLSPCENSCRWVPHYTAEIHIIKGLIKLLNQAICCYEKCLCNSVCWNAVTMHSAGVSHRVVHQEQHKAMSLCSPI